MSDKKTRSTPDDKSPELSQDVPMVTEKVAPKSNFAKADQDKQQGKSKDGGKQDSGAKGGKTPPPSKPTKARGKSRGWLWLIVLLVLLAAAVAAAWYLVPGAREQLSGQLQKLPVVGSRFETNGPAPASVRDKSEAGTAVEQPAAVPSAGTADSTGTAADSDNSDAPATTIAPPAITSAAEPGTDQPAPPTADAGATPAPAEPVIPQQPDQVAILQEQLQRQDATIRQLQQQLATVQRSVTAQANRLSELGNASRQDWQLAEADYLLRLANQRLMLEQDSRAALGLLQEVDKIVRDVDLPDLYGVRQQLARDLTALKLVENVDREGLYLRLRALEEQLVRLNIQPKFDLARTQPEKPTPAAEDAATGSDHFRNSWDNFTRFLQESVRIRDAEIDPVLLSPQSETRFRQSLRLNMEQAELALLRADSRVYQDALGQARDLLLQYGVDNAQRQVLLKELEELSTATIAADLPNLNASQSALRNYIERLHKTASGQSDGGDTQ